MFYFRNMRVCVCVDFVYGLMIVYSGHIETTIRLFNVFLTSLSLTSLSFSLKYDSNGKIIDLHNNLRIYAYTFTHTLYQPYNL